MDKQAKEARQMAKVLPLREKIAYIWQYYKWWIIGITVGALVIGVTVYEMCNQPTYDLEVGYYAQGYISDGQVQAMEDYLSQFVEDVDGDGERRVRVYPSSLSMMGDSPDGVVAMQTKFMAELTAGQYPVFFFDSTFYDAMQGETFADAAEYFWNMSENAALREGMQLSEDQPVYWATRSLYQNEEKKEKKITAHDHARRVEEAIFGPRPADA